MAVAPPPHFNTFLIHMHTNSLPNGSSSSTQIIEQQYEGHLKQQQKT
jgi:hypothetical protein